MVGRKLKGTDFYVDPSCGFYVTSSLFSSNVKRKFGIPTGCLIWTQNEYELYASVSSAIVGSSISSALLFLLDVGQD